MAAWRGSFKVQQIMRELMEQGKDMLEAGFVCIDQNALFARKEFPVDIIGEITDEFDGQAKVFGRFAKEILGSDFHFVLA